MFKDFGGDNYSFENRQLEYRHFFSSELLFMPESLYISTWINGKLSEQESEEFLRDFGISSLGYYFESVFRVFREWDTGNSSHILVNEQMYLVNREYYLQADQLSMKQRLGLNGSDKAESFFQSIWYFERSFEAYQHRKVTFCGIDYV